MRDFSGEKHAMKAFWLGFLSIQCGYRTTMEVSCQRDRDLKFKLKFLRRELQKRNGYDGEIDDNDDDDVWT